MTLNDPTSEEVPVAPAYGTPVVARRPSRLLRWVLFGFGGLILVGGSCIGGFYLLMKRGQAEVEPVAEAFVATMSIRDYKTAHALFTAEARQAVNADDFEWFGKKLDALLGAIQTKDVSGFRVNKNTAGSEASLVYDVTFAKGPGTLTIILREVGGNWVVHGYFVHSPLMLKLLKCTHCNKQANGLFRFCPSCGKEVPDSVP
jgi:hypothetical protein